MCQENIFHLLRKVLRDAMKNGVLAGYPMDQYEG